jgi:hypothetical protein
MYAFSQPGEIGKRDLESGDIDSIAELYSEAYQSPDVGGCGGAAIAGYDGEPWLWAAVGLSLMGLLMRRRATRGTALGASAMVAMLLGVGSSSSAPADLAGADWFGAGFGDTVPMKVTESEASWEGDLIVTRLSLRSAAPGVPDVTVRALGGQVDHLVQVIGHALPPRVGQDLRVRVRQFSDSGGVWLSPIVTHD